VANALIIRLPAVAGNAVEWVTVDHSGAGVGTPERGQLVDAAPFALNRKLIILVPASQVLRLNVRIPLKGNARIRQALPYALEEHVAGDIEKQHFAFGRQEKNGLLPVAVTEMATVNNWLELLAEHELIPTGIYAESDAIEPTPATIKVLLDNDQVIILNAAGEVTVADEPAMETLLELFLDQQAAELENDATVAPVSLIIYCSDRAYKSQHVLWERLRMRTENLEIKILTDGALPFLANQISMQANVNLLQGAFAPKSELPFKWEQWRIAAVLLAAFLVLNFGYKGAEYWQLSKADAALDAAAAEVLSGSFPGTGEVADPWDELHSRLGTEGATDMDERAGLTEALEALSVAFAKTPGIRMETVSFRSGAIDLQLIAPDVAALDQLRQLISTPGRFSAEIQSANPSDDVIKGRIHIEPAEKS
jgi:general secretion pathway protein L